MATIKARPLRLRPYELIIFAILTVLLALCLCAPPLIGSGPDEGGASLRAPRGLA